MPRFWGRGAWMAKVAALLVILSGLALASPAQPLFTPVSGPRAGDASSKWVVRSREVRVQLARMPGASASDALRGLLPPGGHRLVLNLFADVVVRARMTRSERQGSSFVWVGKVEGQPFGDVVLSVYDGILSGSVVSPGGAYRIRFDGRRQVVEELDDDAFPDDNCFREAPVGRCRAGGRRAPRRRRRLARRRAGRLHAGRARRGGRDRRDPLADEPRHRGDEHRLPEQRGGPAPAPGRGGGGGLHRVRRHRRRPRPRHRAERRDHRRRAHAAQHVPGRPGLAHHEHAGQPVLRHRLAHGRQQPRLRAERLQRRGALLHDGVLQLRPRARPQHGPQPRARRPGGHGGLLLLVRLQVDGLPDGDGLRARHAGPVLLEPQRPAPRAADRGEPRPAPAPRTTR